MWTRQQVVSERRQPQSNKLGLSSCEKHNLSTSNKIIHHTSVDIKINVVDNNFCNGESHFYSRMDQCSLFKPMWLRKQEHYLQTLWWWYNFLWKSIKVQRYCNLFIKCLQMWSYCIYKGLIYYQKQVFDNNIPLLYCLR